MLLVDDSAIVRAVITRNLEAHGLEVIASGDAIEALRVLGSGGAIDVVLTDISMAPLDGIELLRSVRARDMDLPVLLMTGEPTLETAIEAVDLGALAYLAKPFEPDQLLAAVDRAVSLGRLARLKRTALEAAGSGLHRASDRMSLEETFLQCLETMWIAFQPVVRADGTLFGYEALLRSREAALPHPGAVLDAAEALGRMSQLGRRVRQLVVDATKDTDTIVFVNLHAADLFEDDLLDTEKGLAQRASRVVLEITERAAMGEVSGVRRRVEKLRAVGYRVAIDDLGAGYAGLTAFASLEPDVCKLDMSLVRDVDRLPKRQALVRSMARLCRDLDVGVVAEGVETVAELEFLRTCGCDFYQGFLLGRPGPAFPAVTWPASCLPT